MALEVDFVPFANGTAANVTAQATYIEEATTTTGFVSGVAPSADCNKAWRQATVIAAALANVVANTLNENVLDNGSLSTLIAQITAAIQAPATTAQNNAESYALTQATAAETAAKTYAASQASAAQSNAEAFATSAANTAETNAIVISENQAQAYANTAQSNAETYTDNYVNSEIATEVTNRNAAIAVSLSTAESYAASVAATAQSNAETYADGTGSIAASGWYKYPNGMIEIWGTMAAQATNEPLVTMSRSFPNACFGVKTTPISPTIGNASICNVIAKPAAGATQFYLNMSVQNLPVYWEARGN